MDQYEYASSEEIRARIEIGRSERKRIHLTAASVARRMHISREKLLALESGCLDIPITIGFLNEYEMACFFRGYQRQERGAHYEF